MPFEQAKSDFEAKTKTPPKSVEGGEKTFKKFKSRTKAYLANKKNEVAAFNTTYPGHEADKTKFTGRLSKALDQVLDKATEKEKHDVTKKEIAIYRGVLTKESVKLRNKMERKTVERDFQATLTAFNENGITFDNNQVFDAYLKVSKAKRVPIKTIEAHMKPLLKDGSDSGILLDLLETKPSIFTVFKSFVSGNLPAALKGEKVLRKRIDMANSVDSVLKKTGLKRLGFDDMHKIMKDLVKSGVKYEKVADYIVGGLEKVKKLDPENYEALVANMGVKDLVQFLSGAIVNINNNPAQRSLDAMRLSVLVEGALAKARNETMRKMQQAKKEQDEIKKSLKEYQKEHPKIELDKKIAEYQRDIAKYDFWISVHEHNQIITQAKHTFANLLMARRDFNPSSAKDQATISKIIKAKNYTEFKRVAGSSKIKSPPHLNAIQAASMKIDVLESDYHTKKWIADNKTIVARYPIKDPHRIRYGEVRFSPLDVHKKFIETGNLSEAQIAILGLKYQAHSKRLSNIYFKHLILEDDANKEFRKFSKNNTRTINQVPAKERFHASTSAKGYLNTLSTMHGTCIQIISQLQSILILQNKSKNPRNPINEMHDVKEKIKEFKQRAAELKKKAQNVAKFLNSKIEGDTDDIDSLTASPLYGPLMKKRIDPYMKRITDKENFISKRYALVATINPYLRQKLEAGAPPAIITHGFDRGTRILKNFAQSMMDARLEAKRVRSELAHLLEDPGLPAGIPKSVQKMFKDMIKNKIEIIDKSLTNRKSPLSTFVIMKAIAEVGKWKAKQDKYYMDGFKRGIAIAACIAVAAFAAFAGGLAMGALGGKLFGTVAAGGAFVPGAITVSATTAKILVGGMVLVGSSAGGVIGSRLAMTGFDVSGFTNFGGLKKIWNPKAMGKEFLISFGLSLLAVGAAHGITKAADWASKAKYFRNRFPGLSLRFQNFAARRQLQMLLKQPAAANVSAVQPAKLTRRALKIVPGKVRSPGTPPPLSSAMKAASKQHHKLRIYWHNNFRRAVSRRMARNPGMSIKQAERAVLKDPKHRFLAQKVKDLNLRRFNPRKPDLITPAPRIPKAHRPPAAMKGRRATPPPIPSKAKVKQPSRPGVDAEGTVRGKNLLKPGGQPARPQPPARSKPAPSKPRTTANQPVLKVTSARQRERMFYKNKFRRDVDRHMDENGLTNTPANRLKAENAVLKANPALKAKLKELNIRSSRPGKYDLGTSTPRVAPKNRPPAATKGRRTEVTPPPVPKNKPQPGQQPSGPGAQPAGESAVTAKHKIPKTSRKVRESEYYREPTKVKVKSSEVEKVKASKVKNKSRVDRKERFNKAKNKITVDAAKKTPGQLTSAPDTTPDTSTTEHPKTKVIKKPRPRRNP